MEGGEDGVGVFVRLLNIFKPQPVLDEETTTWLFDLYTWALRHFDARIFRDHTVLVLPNDRFFPGRVDSVEGMAELVCNQVKKYAAIGHWPTRLVDNRQCQLDEIPTMELAGPIRMIDGVAPDGAQRLPILYDPAMVNNPQAMVAGFAHAFAFYLAGMAPEPPPGGDENRPHAAEVLATFLGFGVVMANSAFNVRVPRCGSCAPQPVDRQSFLSQYDMTYALAIFCVLKGIDKKAVLPNLKGSLRGFFKKSLKDVSRREELIRLRPHLQ